MDIFYSDIITNDTIELSTTESHHCSKVLRNNIGDKIQILDGKGNKYICKIIINNKKKVLATILTKESYKNKPNDLHLIIAPTKSQDRIDWLVEKSIEIGVGKISFMKTNKKHKVQ